MQTVMDFAMMSELLEQIDAELPLPAQTDISVPTSSPIKVNSSSVGTNTIILSEDTTLLRRMNSEASSNSNSTFVRKMTGRTDRSDQIDASMFSLNMN